MEESDMNASPFRLKRYFFHYSALLLLFFSQSGYSWDTIIDITSPPLCSNVLKGTPITIHYKIDPIEVNQFSVLLAIPCDGVEAPEAGLCNGSIAIHSWEYPDNQDEATYVWETTNVPEGGYWIWLYWGCEPCPSYGMLKYATKINILSKPPTPNLTTPRPEVDSGQTYTLEWNYMVCSDGYELQESGFYNMSGAATYPITSVATLSLPMHHLNPSGAVKIYYYRIRAVNNAMGVKGDWSNTLLIEVDPSASKLDETPAPWMDGDVLLVPKTAVPPAIDGLLDPVWKNTPEVMQQYYDGNRADWFDLWGSFRLMWDDTYLYGFMDAYDDRIVDSHANRWEQDGWELFFDADNSKGATYDGVNDGQFRINHHDAGSAAIDVPDWFANKSDVVYANRNKENGLGWTMEWKIPLSSLRFAAPYANRTFGLEMQQNDNDGTARECRSKWWNVDDNSYQNASRFGTARLARRTTNADLDVWNTIGFPPGAPDGVLDDTWFQLPPFSDQLYCWSNTSDNYDQTLVSDWSDARFNFRMGWSSSNLFLFVRLWDDVKVLTADSGNPWESDAVEIFIDGDNNKGDAYDGANDNQIIVERKDQTAADITVVGANPGGASSIQFKNRETPSGWDLEMIIPLNILGISPTEGSKFGFELQMDDNDTGDRDAIRRWWNWNSDSWKNTGLFGTAELVGPSGRLAPSAVADRPAASVTEFGLGRNYPNPFNSSTKIGYTLKTGGKVRLTVVDPAGRELAVLVDGVQGAGSHEVSFSGTGLISGIYIYRLQTVDGTATGKMSYIK
jgi:hypothetical protein